MSVFEYEGLALPVSGYEDDYLQTGEAGDGYLGICKLVSMASGVDITANINWDFECEGLASELDDEHEEERAQYRQMSGREYPPVFRVQIRVAAEECSPEETAAYWARLRARHSEGGEK